nr:MAG TPA: hypothetical protein [Caudoviricetes sp.]
MYIFPKIIPFHFYSFIFLLCFLKILLIRRCVTYNIA